jgi:hypothetical protein
MRGGGGGGTTAACRAGRAYADPIVKIDSAAAASASMFDADLRIAILLDLLIGISLDKCSMAVIKNMSGHLRGFT